MADVDTIFNNAKQYNEDGSEIFEDAEALQAEAHRLLAVEMAKPDNDPSLRDARQAHPGGIRHNGELWKVGDWVHIQNPNDATKPIVAQVFETWTDEGTDYFNACWYYRPEQTVHQHEKHFYPNEVVKTSQYRDHTMDEIVGRCFVMFFTRFHRGRPRGIAPDCEIYVVEARYNESNKQMHKIKTWLNCIPEAVRDTDYEMDLFDTGVRRVKKVPSPLLHMLKDGDKDEGKMPQPQWGADKAPPIVGGIYKGPRPDNVSTRHPLLRRMVLTAPAITTPGTYSIAASAASSAATS